MRVFAVRPTPVFVRDRHGGTFVGLRALIPTAVVVTAPLRIEAWSSVRTTLSVGGRTLPCETDGTPVPAPLFGQAAGRGFVAVVFNYTIVNTVINGLHSYSGL